jgi:hypothetical protein
VVVHDSYGRGREYSEKGCEVEEREKMEKELRTVVALAEKSRLGK